MLALVLTLGLALAQEPAEDSSAARPTLPAIELVAPSTTLTRDVPLMRWPDSDVEVTRLPAGTEVEVVYREGDRVRVRKDLDFGWVPADAIGTPTPAAPPDRAATDAPEPPSSGTDADGSAPSAG
ncbi:MAG: hypothetical protein D6798_20605 [Deltaproteobacteria bacterium]|nr:MAG: hypothetical protein D6798_20605 [Deltaproteobacteria bacterium]